jgi:hypothetical protein
MDQIDGKLDGLVEGQMSFRGRANKQVLSERTYHWFVGAVISVLLVCLESMAAILTGHCSFFCG